MKRIFSGFLVASMTTACCVGTIIPEVKQEGWKVGGIYLLHRNPRPGDFAEYHVVGRTVVGGTIELDYYWEGTKIVEILSIRDGLVEIREYLTTDRIRRDGGSSLMSVSAAPPVTRHIVTRLDGRIIQMEVNGVRQEIAVPGENGYMEYTEGGDAVPVDIEAGKFTARPAFCQARRGYTLRHIFVNQNNAYDEISIRYTSDEAMFRTAIEQMVVSGKFDSTVSTSRMAQVIVQSLTLTPFFSNPSSLITGPGRGNLRKYLDGSILPDKRDMVDKIIANLVDITTKSPFNNSGVAYLRRQGNRYGQR